MLPFLHALSITCSSLFTVVLVPNVIIIKIITCPKNHVHIIIIIIIIMFILFRFVGDSCKNSWWTDQQRDGPSLWIQLFFFSGNLRIWGYGPGGLFVHWFSSVMNSCCEIIVIHQKKRNQMLYSTNNCCQTNGYLLMLVTYKVQSYTMLHVAIFANSWSVK